MSAAALTPAEKVKVEKAKKAAEKAAAEKVKGAKAAKKTWKEWAAKWMAKSGKRYFVGAAAVVFVAVLYKYYASLPPDLSTAHMKAAHDNYLIGNTYFEQGDISQAILHYRTALATNPKHSDCWTNLGNAFSSAMHYHPDHRDTLYSEGTKAYQAALEANPKHVEANFNMGVLHHTMDDIPKAIVSYERAIQLDPKHYDALSNLGSARHKQQDLDGAIHAYQGAIELVTQMNPVQVEQTQVSMLYYLLGAALSALPSHRCKGASCAEYAAQKLRVALRYNPNNEEAKHALSALVADPSITTASNAYIKSLFDEYAATFDKALVQGLNYSAPQKLFEVVTQLAEKNGVKTFKTVVDVGCGTGLCGPLFRNMSGTLVGVDLSSEMVEHARARKVYDELYVEEITESLARYSNRTDKEKLRAIELMVAADVFVYSGELEGVFKSAAQSLSKGGWFALTLERLFRNKTAEEEAAATADKGKADADKIVDIKMEAAEDAPDAPKAQEYTVSEEDLSKGWKLQLSGRFAHTEKYVTDLAAANSFQILHHEHFVPRTDQGVDIPGQLIVLKLTQ